MRPVFSILILLVSSCTSTQIKNTGDPDWAFRDFIKADSVNPIMKPSDKQVFYCPVSRKEVHWEGRNVLNPAAVIKDGKVYLLYRAQDSAMTSRIGLAMSDDGFSFKRSPSPVLFPDSDKMLKYEWPGGVEDPRVVQSPEGFFVMTYTAYDGKTARLCLATSDDLLHWKKQGLVLGADKYHDLWSKSGAILAQLNGDRIIALKILNRYWMYFGDSDIFMATSDDLIHWTPCEDSESEKIISVLHPRRGYFDSRLVEPGPFALETGRGIVLIYNGSNAREYNDSTLPAFTYSAGQALFDVTHPYKLIDRTKENFIRPDKDYERTGQVNEVCFVEGLVHLNTKWLLYYGTADSRIAVAVSNQ